MPKIIHLVPYEGVGGVETAARTMSKEKHGSIDFEVAFIFKNVGSAGQRWASFNPYSFFQAVRKVLLARPDVLIVSLWRSAIVGVLAKVLMPRLKLVAFIHNATDVHWLDFIFTRMAAALAYEVWADSQASQRGRLPHVRPEKCRVISFVTRRFVAQPPSAARPDFIFWGRITPQKGLDRALQIFAEVLKRLPNARFWIVGPDGGILSATQQLCKQLGLSEAVVFTGVATQDAIPAKAKMASFYLQTSQFEGMAMSVVEAMQLGLVPVVTPVGEISSYCVQGENAVVVETDEQALEGILTLLNCDAKYQVMRSKAIATWNDKPLYAESVLQACEAMLAVKQEAA